MEAEYMEGEKMDTGMFTGRAFDYTHGRPLYAEAFIKLLAERFGVGSATVTADIGSGTGKFSGQLLKLGCRVYSVEPNEHMRLEAERILGKNPLFCSVKGDASSLNLPVSSCDLVTAAQAFHWFSPLDFRRECIRILKPGGYVFLIWNMRDMDCEINRESYQIYKKYCPGFLGFGGGIKKNDSRIRQFFTGEEYLESSAADMGGCEADFRNVCEVMSFDHPLYFTKEKFIKRSRSGSYSLKETDKGYKEYILELEKAFDRYAVSDILKMPNHTMVYAGPLQKHFLRIE